MAEILDVVSLSKSLKLVKLKDKYLSQAKMGQFFVMQYFEKPERLQFFIMDNNREEQTATFLFDKDIDISGEVFDVIKPNDRPHYIEGPAGKPFEALQGKNILFVSVGAGFNGIYNIAKHLKDLNRIDLVFIDKEDFVFEHVRDFENIFEEVYNDHSIEAFNKIKKRYDVIVSAGDNEILAKLVSIYKDSLVIGAVNTRMLCTVGLCLSCRINYDGKLKLPCVEGPWLDISKVDLQDLKRRQIILKEILVHAKKG